MEYLEKSRINPIPEFPIRKGEIGLVETWSWDHGTAQYVPSFLVVQIMDEMLPTYNVLAKCADKFLAHKIREACEKELDRVKIQEEDLDCSLKAKNDYGIN